MKKVISILLAVVLCVMLAAFASDGNLYGPISITLDNGISVEFETAIHTYDFVSLDAKTEDMVSVIRVKPGTMVSVSQPFTADVHTWNSMGEYYSDVLERESYAYLKDGTVEVRTGKIEWLFETIDYMYATYLLLGTIGGEKLLVEYYDVDYIWQNNPFEDVSPWSYYYEAVLWAYYRDVTTGTSATSFSPESTCTRGQVVTFLWRALNCPEPETKINPFKDVKPSDYYYKAVLWAVEEGITNGTSATTFSPNATCKYEHVLTFLWRALGTPMPFLSHESNPFGTTAYYAEAFEFAAEYGMIDYEINPAAFCPRADIVEFMYRVMPK